MANPRQRAKARSHKSTGRSLQAKRRLHHKLRKPPPLKGPEVLQASWDRHKTVFQNYAALGLLPSIPLPTGASGSKSHKAKLPFLPPHMRSDAENEVVAEAQTPRIGFGRIVRDDEGNVIDIILDEEEDERIEEDEEEEREVEGKTEVVKQLESLAATAAPVIRHSSTSEKEWLRQLAVKYNEDVERMARDRHLNVWQKTPGELKRMLRKAGGAEKLRAIKA